MSEVKTRAPDEWARLITDNFIGLAVSGADDNFEGVLDPRDLGNGITLTAVRTAPAQVLRTSRLVRSDACDDVLFLLHLSGEGAAVWQEGQHHQMPPGYGTIHLASRPYGLSFESSSRELVLQAPRRLLPSQELVSADRRLSGADPGDPALRVYSSFVRELLAVSDDLSHGVREEMGHTALELLISILRQKDRDNGTSGARSLFHAMKHYVREHLGDPDLTPDGIASRHNVSLRFVQQLFSDSGSSPAVFIRNERLERSCRILSDPRYTKLPVAAVAHQVGFTSVDTFIRAFRKRYGMTPGDWRSSAAL